MKANLGVIATGASRGNHGKSLCGSQKLVPKSCLGIATFSSGGLASQIGAEGSGMQGLGLGV